MTDTDLKPLEPRKAMEMWLDRQRSVKSEATIQSYYYRLKQFVDWCESEGIDNLNELTGRDLYRFDSSAVPLSDFASARRRAASSAESSVLGRTVRGRESNPASRRYGDGSFRRTTSGAHRTFWNRVGG